MDGERKEVPFATSKSAPPEGSKLSVFISYSRDDLAFADQLAAGLTLGGFEPTIDRSGISGGEDWKLRLGALIRNAETVVFVLSPASAQSPICKWEVEEAVRLGKRIIPVPCRPLEGVAAPPQLAGLNYIFFYDEPRSPGSGFGTGLVRLVSALNTDVEWLHEHTRLLQRASEWQAAGRAESRLLFGDSIVEAKTWAETRPKDAPEPTALHYEFIRASEDAEARRQSIERQRLEERERLVRDAEVAQYQRDAAARRVVQRTLFGLVVAIVLALVAGGFGIYALQQRKEAEVQGRQAVSLKEQAEAEAKRARTARDEALLTQSRYLADVSRSVLEQDKDPGTAMLLALEALPDKASDDEAQRDRPYWAPAEVSLEASRRLLRERFILKGDAEDVTCVSISPDGTRIASGSYKKARIWNSDGKLLAVLGGHNDSVISVQFSPDASQILTASKNNDKAMLWSADGKLLGELEGHELYLTSAVFSPDGRRVLTASDDKTARVWGADGKPLAILKGHEDPVTNAVFSPDGRRIVTAADKVVTVWDSDTFAEVGRLRHSKKVTSLAVGRTKIVTGSEDDTARVWDANTFAELGQLKPNTYIFRVGTVALSPDETRIVVSAVYDDTVRVWDATTFAELAQLKHTGYVTSVAISQDGARVVTASDDHTVHVWDASTFTDLLVLKGHTETVNAVAMNPDGTRIVTGSWDKTVRVWDARTFVGSAVALKHKGGASGLVSDGKSVISQLHDYESHDFSAEVWNVSPEVVGSANERATVAILNGHSNWISSAVVSPDGSRIITGSFDKTVRVWERRRSTEPSTKHWQTVGILKGHTAEIRSIALSPDGTRIVTGSWDKTVRIWDAKTFAQLAVLKGPTDNVESVAFSPDGSRIVAGSWDKTARVWDAKNLAELAVLTGHRDIVTSVAFSPDGTRIITGSGSAFGGGDTSVRLWDAKTFAQLDVLKGHTGTVNKVTVTPDGSRIVSASRDGTVRLWDAKNFTEQAVLRGNDGVVLDVAVISDGSRVVTNSVTADQFTVRVWDLFPTGQGLVAQAKAIVRRCLTPEQRDLYHLAPAPPSWCSTAQAWPYDIVSIVDAALDAVEKREIEPRHREALAVVAEAIAHDSNARARIAPILGRFNGIAFNRFLDTQLRGHTTNTLKDVLPLADIAVAFTEEKPDTLRDALDTRGQILFALGRTDEAFADLDKAITLGLRAAGTFYARGRVYELRGNRDAAINDYRESLSLSSSDADYADHVHELARDRLTALGDSPAFLQQ